MNMHVAGRAMLVIACLLSVGCQKNVADKPADPIRIIATDSGFEAPATMPPGRRHLLFENRGNEIHEAMLVKLPQGVSPADFVAAVKGGALFPKGALDYSGPGLTSPGESIEIWLTVDPGDYILVCWNSGHATSTAVHPFAVRGGRADDPVPKEDVVVKLFDFRFDLVGELRGHAGHSSRNPRPGHARSRFLPIARRPERRGPETLAKREERARPCRGTRRSAG